MKNYYEELEIDKNASKEVIEKVYKVLAKKYHPDVSKDNNKQESEEKFKKINEAYEVLSDDIKRKQYDEQLSKNDNSVSYEEYIKIVNERDKLNNYINNLKRTTSVQNTSQSYYNTSNNNYSNNLNNKYNNQYTYNQQTSTNNNNSNQKHQYYYTSTGQPASAFDYYAYKFKQAFKNLGLIILSIIAILLMINSLL